MIIFNHGEGITGNKERRVQKMKMEKILNSGWGIVFAVLALLVAGRTVRLISWMFFRVGGYAVLGGLLVLALLHFRNRN